MPKVTPLAWTADIPGDVQASEVLSVYRLQYHVTLRWCLWRGTWMWWWSRYCSWSSPRRRSAPWPDDVAVHRPHWLLRLKFFQGQPRGRHSWTTAGTDAHNQQLQRPAAEADDNDDEDDEVETSNSQQNPRLLQSTNPWSTGRNICWTIYPQDNASLLLVKLKFVSMNIYWKSSTDSTRLESCMGMTVLRR